MAGAGRTPARAPDPAPLIPRRPPPVRILFFGTPEFALPTLERLLVGPHTVVGAITQPDRPRGRGRARSPSPVATCAAAAGIPVLRPERVADALEAMRSLAPDVGVVVAFGQFLPRPVRELPRCGYLINAHASLLPRHRGAAPVAHAILAGDRETGISVMRVEREMDAGPVASALRTAIGPEENAGELAARLALLAADGVESALAAIATGRLTWTPQDHGRASTAPKLEAAAAELDFRLRSDELCRRIRALAPRPGACTPWRGERLRILAARVHAATPAGAGGGAGEPGEVRVAGDAAYIATSDGWLEPTRLQRPGGVAMETAALQRGRGLRGGERLGPAAEGGDRR